MSFIEDFKNRGYFYQCTDLEELTALTNNKKIAGYIGFDCTAKSLHVGNLMQIMLLRLFQQHGHKPIIIIGGGTSKIGDPTGKEQARKILTDEELQQNLAGIKRSLSKFLKFGSNTSDAIILNNAEWLESLGYIEFLKSYGKLFSVNQMIAMDSIRLRLEREQSLTFLEFNYMLLQAYDFYHLNHKHDCLIQFGGSDQWGNIVMGVDLIRKLSKTKAYGLTTPLLTTSSGAKMGKTANGAVWLNEDMLSPYEYYQYWRNCDDSDALKFAKLYAEYTKEELVEFSKLAENDINSAKKQLAFSVTALCHGHEEAIAARDSSIKTFEQGESGDSLPTFIINKERLAAGISIVTLLVETKLASSRSEARRLIEGGGARINNSKVLEENMVVNLTLISNEENKIIKLSAGKKQHVVVKITG